MNTAVSLYELDFYDWIQRQADSLRARKFSELDLDNLVEEIETMGRSERRSLTSALTLLLMHLIKWQYQPLLRSRSWSLTIRNQRHEVAMILKDSPSLKSFLASAVETAWQKARNNAESETGIEESRFPLQCPWPFEVFMNNDFWPD